ncbi:MAG: hypothetical protein EOO51_14070 [Flavobacterium sp.]|nr:MAG: hypothetical protein EOO51_14070 [Flavobacterium sp.]
MKKLLCVVFIASSLLCSAQKKTVRGQATDSTHGGNVIEIIVNDTLSKLMKDPKKGRNAYLRLYQDPRYVVRTDSTGAFKIQADETDSLYFKSYRHLPQRFLVRDLLKNGEIKIILKPDPDAKD